MFVDKEETGSAGDTGAQSRLLENFAAEIQRKLSLSETTAEILERATAVSGDVTEALNPNFKEISDARNSSRLGGGVSIEKYGGSGGKYSCHDSSSEFMGWLVRLMEDAGVKWQTGEMGKIDQGGGGTIAYLLSQYGMDAIDAGPPLLSMHSTQELSSKVDLYYTFRCFQAFLKA
jgi:aspartyl aminopeptidase